jgi:hypothetical protein
VVENERYTHRELKNTWTDRLTEIGK